MLPLRLTKAPTSSLPDSGCVWLRNNLVVGQRDCWYRSRHTTQRKKSFIKNGWRRLHCVSRQCEKDSQAYLERDLNYEWQKQLKAKKISRRSYVKTKGYTPQYMHMTYKKKNCLQDSLSLAHSRVHVGSLKNSSCSGVWQISMFFFFQHCYGPPQREEKKGENGLGGHDPVKRPQKAGNKINGPLTSRVHGLFSQVWFR